MAAKKQWYTQKTIARNLHIKIVWYLAEVFFYRILNNKNFKMEVVQTNLVTQLIITVQLYYWLSKNRLLKFGQISFKW